MKNDLKIWMSQYKTPSIYKLTNKTIEYIHNKDWYTDSKKQIESIFDGKSDLFIDLLAITSPRNTVKLNVMFAIDAFYRILNNKPLIKKYGLADKNIKRNIKRLISDGIFSGKKIVPFAKALKGDSNAIVIDVWMLKVFNIKRQAPTDRDIRNISIIINKIANKLNLKPSEVQACLWCYAKTELNKTQFKETYDFSYYLKEFTQAILLRVNHDIVKDVIA